MAQQTTPAYAADTTLGMYPCEGPKVVKVSLPFGSDTIQLVDLSVLQNKGEFSAAQAIYVDNSANGSSVVIECNVSYQTLTVPANKQAYLPVLQPNPPKFKFTSAGGVTVPVHFVNFFMPPCVWS